MRHGGGIHSGAARCQTLCLDAPTLLGPGSPLPALPSGGEARGPLPSPAPPPHGEQTGYFGRNVKSFWGNVQEWCEGKKKKKKLPSFLNVGVFFISFNNEEYVSLWKKSVGLRIIDFILLIMTWTAKQIGFTVHQGEYWIQGPKVWAATSAIHPLGGSGQVFYPLQGLVSCPSECRKYWCVFFLRELNIILYIALILKL